MVGYMSLQGSPIDLEKFIFDDIFAIFAKFLCFCAPHPGLEGWIGLEMPWLCMVFTLGFTWEKAVFGRGPFRGSRVSSLAR